MGSSVCKGSASSQNESLSGDSPVSATADASSRAVAGAACERALTLPRPAAATLGGLLLILWASVLLRAAYAWPTNSDNVSVVLTGQSMLQGNWNLHGWWLGPAPFWTTEVPIFAAAVLVGGVNPDVARVVAALVWFAIGLLSVSLAAFGLRGRLRWLSVVITFAFTGVAGPGLVQSGIHNTTAMFALAGVLAAAVSLARPRARVAAATASALLIVSGTGGDALALAVAAAPIIGVSAACAVWEGRLRPWVWALGAAGVASLVAGLMRWLVTRSGGFSSMTPLVVVTRPHRAVIQESLRTIASFLGLTPSSTWQGAALLLARLALIAIAVAGATAAVRSLAGRREVTVNTWLTSVLLVAAASNLAAFTLLAADPLAAWRRLVPACLCLGIACGRLVASAAASSARVELIAGIGAALVLFGQLQVGVTLAHSTAAPNPARDLAAWLEYRHLQQGYAGYWDSNAVTVAAAERVRVYALTGGRDGRLTPFRWNSEAEWYDSERTTPTFVVFNPDQTYGVERTNAQRTFGPPDEEQRAGPYVVMIWHRNLASSLVR